jgi:hypothetical protein
MTWLEAFIWAIEQIFGIVAIIVIGVIICLTIENIVLKIFDKHKKSL